jgi:predicted aconitase
VEGVTPDAKEKGKKLLAKGYETYVIDDKEQARIISTFPNLWPEKDGDPTAAFIGCPHNSYHEVIKWGKLVTEALDKAGKKKAAMPVYMFMPNPVRDRAIEEHGELISKMKRAGMRATNMCSVSYAGMKGFSDRVRGVTNSAKTRNYSTGTEKSGQQQSNQQFKIGEIKWPKKHFKAGLCFPVNSRERRCSLNSRST